MNPTADRYQVLLANVDSAQGHPKVCCICIKKFGFSSGQTPCFRCKRAVCKDCLVERQRVVVVKKTSTETEKKKVCKHCNNEMQAQQSISSLSEGLNKDSVTSIKWLAALGLISKEEASKVASSVDITPQLLQPVQQAYQKAVEGAIVSVKEVKFKEFILRKTNYSLVQHLHETVTGQKYEEISDVLCRLVNKLAKHYNWERSPLKVDVICLFLLTFASEASTYGIFTRLYESVLPRYFVEFILSNRPNDNSFLKSELWKNQVTHLYQTLLLNSNFDDATKKLCLLFLERYSLDMLTSLFINILPFSLAFLSVDALITQHNFQVIENNLVSIVIENAEILKEMQGSNYVSMHSFLERTVNPEEISKRAINQLASSSEDQKAKEADKSKGLINPSQFEQNFHDMMLSPQFNILINDNEALPDVFDDNDEERQQSVSRQASKQLTQHNAESKQEQLKNSQIDSETKSKDSSKEQQANNADTSVPETKVVDKQLEKALKEEQDKSAQREQVLAQKEQVLAQREQVIAQLRLENERFSEQLANQQKELETAKGQLANEHKQCQELEAKAAAALKERDQVIEEVKEEKQTPRAQLLEKYKKQVNEQRNLLADLVARSQSTEQQLIADKEKILSDSIAIKNKLITELSAASERCLQLTHELEAERNKSDEIKKQGAEKEIELNKQIDEFKRKQAADQAQKATQMSIYEQKYIGEITVLSRKSEADKAQITQYSQTIASLQSQLAQNISSNKDDIKHFTDQCNIAYLELRKQIEELEFEVGSLREQFKKASEQLTSSQAKFDSDLKSVKKQSDDEKAQLRDSLDKEKALYLEQNEKEIQSREQLIVELRKRLEYLERCSRADSVRITDEFETTISSLTAEVEKLKREKESTDREKNAEITSLRVQTTTQGKKIQEQSAELESLNKQVQELNDLIQGKIKAHSSNQLQITEKDNRILQLEQDLSAANEKLKKSEGYVQLIDSLQKELQETKENSSSLEEKIRLLNLQLQLVQSNLDSSNAALNSAKADIEKLQNSILKKDADYSELEKAIQLLKEELQKTKEAYQNLQNEYNKYYSVIQMVKSSITEADK